MYICRYIRIVDNKWIKISRRGFIHRCILNGEYVSISLTAEREIS